MAEEGQIFPGGEITVATPELNPKCLTFVFWKSVTEVQCQKFWYGGDPPDATMFCEPVSTTTTTKAVINKGDETIDIKQLVYVDGIQKYEQVYLGVPPGSSGSDSVHRAFGELAAGKHTITIELYAKRTTETSYPTTPQYTSVLTVYVYTAALDAIADTVKIVQGTTETEWLTWDPATGAFVASAITIEPDLSTYFKFELTNPGDEPVKMNVGHYDAASGTDITGFLVGGTLFDTVEHDVDVAAGGIATITTQPFTVSAGALSIGTFSVYRARHLI